MNVSGSSSYCKIRKNAYTLQNGQKRTVIIGKTVS